MVNDDTFKRVNIPLSGKLVTSRDGTMLGKGDFQVLKNMRYGEFAPKSVSGMTKINTSVVDATYLKIRSGHHFRKSQPAESHLLVQSWNTGLTDSEINENTTAIPNQGNFSTDPLYSEASGVGIGRFSDAPDGCVAYCNGTDSLIWGGNEYRCAGLIVGDLNGSLLYDYTSKINNTLSDTNNIATMASLTTTLDASTMLLLHMDGTNDSTTFTDSSPTTPHTVTAHGNAKLTTTTPKFGTACGTFDGTTDYLTIPNDADFDLSDGTWTIDFWAKFTGTVDGTYTIYSRATGANDYIRIVIERLIDKNSILLTVKATTIVVSVGTAYDIFQNNVWNHFEIVQNGTYYYIFVNGIIANQASDAQSPASYAGEITYIGAISDGTLAYKGKLDEFRVSNVARHTSSFTPNGMAYPTSTCQAYIASTRPIKGVKFYIGTANTAVSSASVKYWSNGSWNEVSSMVDGTLDTATSTKTLNKTGSITFTSTVGTAKPRMINNVYAYWYLFSFDSIDATTTVYYITLDAPFQGIVDLWDGIMRPIASYLRYTGTKYKDETTNVLKEDYYHITEDPADNLTYSKCASLSTTGYLLCGFTERMTGIDIKMVTDKENEAYVFMNVYYWNGSTWTAVSGLNDGTTEGTVSLGKSGTVSWDVPSESAEFKTSIRSSSRLLYYYKIQFSEALSASKVFIDQVQGIPAQKSIHGYSFPVHWQNRLWLLDEVSNKRNSAICTAVDTIVVFNGEDALSPESPLSFGNDDPLVAGGGLFGRDGGSVYDILVVAKKSEVWLTEGTTIEDFDKNRRKLSGNYGCVAPGTFISCDMGYEIAPGVSKHVLIWASQGAIVLFDGNSLNSISDDISDLFDPMRSTYLTAASIAIATSFFDSSLYEYHFLCSNQEWVYDLRKKKWYQIDRGTGKYIQIGFTVRDTNGIAYTFGTLDTGYVERLENGTTFDGTNITSQFRIGDISIGDWQYLTTIRGIKHMSVSKATTTASVTLSHYGDTKIAASTSTLACPLNSSTHRTVRKVDSKEWGPHLFHSFSASVTISNENIGYEPIGLVVRYQVIREELI